MVFQGTVLIKHLHKTEIYAFILRLNKKLFDLESNPIENVSRYVFRSY